MTARYIVTFIPFGYSEPQEQAYPVLSGDPDVDADALIDLIAEFGDVIHIRWSTGQTIYAADGIDR